MPANWSVLQTQITTLFDNNQTRKSESDVARTIANAYLNSISSANIIAIPGSAIASPATPSLISNGFANTFQILKSKKGKPSPGDYTPAANGIVQFWLATGWSPLPPPIGYVAPINGNQITSGGAPAPLNYNLWNAFNNNVPGKVGAVIASKLVSAFSLHLSQVQGVYTGLIPSPTGPVPGPPFPWLGVA